MIFIFLFAGIVLALLAADSGSGRAAFGAMVCAVVSLLAGLCSGQVGVSLFLAGVVLLCIVLFLLQIRRAGQLEFALAHAPMTRASQTTISALSAFVALLLGLHVFDGDATFSVVSGQVISSQFPAPLNIEGRYGKGLAGLMLLLTLAAITRFDADTIKWRNWWQVPCLAALVVGVAVVLFSLPVDLKFPDIWWRFVLSNLLLTCVAEEAFFRGLLYKYTMDAASWILPAYSVPVAIVVTAVLFMVVHQGPMDYLFMVFVLGCACGWARHVTGSISAAVATHGIVNGVHFFVLKYPLA